MSLVLLGILYTWVIKPVALIALLLVVTRFLMKTFYHKTSQGVNPRLDGATVIVTGGTSGIGKSTVSELLLRGSKVIFTGRDVNAVKNECLPEFLKDASNTQAAKAVGAQPSKNVQSLHAGLTQGKWDENGNFTSSHLWFRRVDFSDLNEIQKFADWHLSCLNRFDWVKSEHREIYALVNNAGGIFENYKTTAQGLEWTIAVNHLSHHYLTDLILPLIAQDGRIVNVASLMSELDAASKLKEPVDFDLFFRPKKEEYSTWGAYSLSKLANVLFARGVQDLLKKQSSNILSVSLHPGSVKTNFLSRGTGILYYLAKVLTPFIDAVFKSNLEGAQTTLHCLTAKATDLTPGAIAEFDQN